MSRQNDEPAPRGKQNKLPELLVGEVAVPKAAELENPGGSSGSTRCERGDPCSMTRTTCWVMVAWAASLNLERGASSPLTVSVFMHQFGTGRPPGPSHPRWHSVPALSASSTFTMVRMSETAGRWFNVTASPVSSAAAMHGSAAFLAPETGTRPDKLTPPSWIAPGRLSPACTEGPAPRGCPHRRHRGGQSPGRNLPAADGGREQLPPPGSQGAGPGTPGHRPGRGRDNRGGRKPSGLVRAWGPVASRSHGRTAPGDAGLVPGVDGRSGGGPLASPLPQHDARSRPPRRTEVPAPGDEP